MPEEKELPALLMIMLCMRCTLGGAEKQYARVFELLTAQPGSHHRLLVNLEMLDILHTAGLLLEREEEVIVLDPPFRRWLLHASSSTLNNRFFNLVAAFLDTVWYAWQCWRAMNQVRPDVVHPLLTGVYLSLPGMLLHPRTGRVLSAYSYSFESYRDKRILGMPIGASLKRFAMQRCDIVDSLTSAIQDDLVRRGIQREKIQTAPCPFFEAPANLQANEKKDWVVFLGRLVDIKNPLLLAQAIPEVLARHPGTKFFFLGRGELQSELEAKLTELGIGTQATVRFEPNPAAVLSQSSIFVSLQRQENYPSQSLLEAMAHANAVVATDVGETWRLVDDANGLRVPAEPSAVAAAINRLLEDPKLPQMRSASRQRVLIEFSTEKYLDHLHGIYQAAAHRRSKG